MVINIYNMAIMMVKVTNKRPAPFLYEKYSGYA